MDCPPESTASTSRARGHKIITGGKPRDHKRPCSPFGLVETTSTSYSSDGEGDNTGHGGGCMLSYYTTGHSPRMSSEEEEDMANCLIMLAQSASPDKEDKSDLCCEKTEKLKYPRLAEMADTTAGGKSDLQNYECKTCNRAFPSFQALGGHRASHKKSKLTVEDSNSVSIKTEFSEDDQPELLVEHEENKIITINNKYPHPLPGSIQTRYKNSKGKIHECSICGSKFLSGQALGGHMRRHRPAPPLSNQIAVSMDNRRHHHNIIEKSPVLALDLNLPAPEVDDDVHLNFEFTESSSQQSLIFPAAALVDCHY